MNSLLLLLPQRYIFSSKSQHKWTLISLMSCCCCYHKGTYFQANHNTDAKEPSLPEVVVATTKVHIFKQITTIGYQQQQHRNVVVATTKVHIFKQITTEKKSSLYEYRCCCYHKGTYFQANHNKVTKRDLRNMLLLLPQRYIFSSKSQRFSAFLIRTLSCCCYHKGTYFQANHNRVDVSYYLDYVVVATTKVHIFKQITTRSSSPFLLITLLLLPQRYIFSSKSQP